MLRSLLLVIFSIAAVCFVVIFVFSEGMRLQVLNSFYNLYKLIPKLASSTTPTAGTTPEDGTKNGGAASTSIPNPAGTPGSSPLAGSSETSTKWTPPGFRGPSGQPRVIGPSGPPPDY